MSPSDDSSTAPTLKPRRNRAMTEAKLRRAVEEILAEAGFGAVTPLSVAKRAGVDKMLIYRYFGDLNGLVRSIAFANDFFPSFEDLLAGRSCEELLRMPVSQRAAYIVERNVQALLQRPVVLELMAWELIERNELTAIMEEARESLSTRIFAELFPDVLDKARLQAIGALHSASVTYLALRRRKIRWYAGLDLKSDADWIALFDSIEVMTRTLNDLRAPE
jgi:AcrR family transcriptional regulator